MNLMKPVLIVDDKPENLYMLRALLEGHGYTVEEARDGAEALAKARLAPPALIISDLLMPLMDGYSLLMHWKADERLKSIPFVVYSGTFTDPQDERLALNLGADAFILKPLEPEVLMGHIREVLEKKERAEMPLGEAQIDEKVLLKEYSETLVRKLEEKALQLEQANRLLWGEIAEREHAEETLRESEERYKALFDRSRDCVFLHDFDGRFLDANQAALELLGYRQEEIRALSIASLLTDDQLPRAFHLIEEIKTAGQHKQLEEFRLRRKDGRQINVEIQASLVYRHGKPVAIQGIARDITEARRARPT